MMLRFAALLAALPGLAWSQTAFVVGADGPVGAFEASGYVVVRATTLDEVAERVGDAGQPVVVYVGRPGARPVLSGEIEDQFKSVAGLLEATSGMEGLAVLIDVCPVAAIVEAWPPVVSDDLLLALPAMPEASCRSGSLAAALDQAARQAPRPLGVILSQRGAWVTGGADAVRIGLADAPPAPAAAGVAVVRNDALVVTRPVRPTIAGAVRLTGVTPVAATVGQNVEAGAGAAQTASAPRADQVVVFNAQRSAERAARPTRPGYPEPSVIVGFITPEEPEDPLADFSIAYDDVAARDALRRDNPDLFALALEAGRLDPPAEAIAAAIQTELSRMQCYTSGIDGIWGNGSRRAVSRYGAQAGLQPVSTEPVAVLFRQIIARDAVTCPAPVVAAPRPAAPTRPQAPAAAQPAPPAAPPPSPGRTIDGGAGGVGIFR